MNIRSLTRGDGVVIGAAVVLFIASFLNQYSVESRCVGGYCPPSVNVNAWEILPTLMSIYLAGIIAAALIVVSRGLPGSRKVAGIELGQFGVALSIFVAWTAFWTIVNGGRGGAGMIIGLIGALVLAAGAIASPLVPALKAPLMGAPKPAVAGNAAYGAQPGAGYGYPGGQQQSYGGQPATGGYGYPGGAQDPQAAAAPAQPSQGGQAPAAADASGFAPFWFAVPVARPLYPEDGSPTPIAELAPGTWYLAVDQRGTGLVAQTQDGRRGLLQDTTGIQRG